MKRVVVTGMGVVTPIGIGVPAFWNGVLEKRVGIDRIKNFNTDGYKAKLSAEVRDFDAKNYLEPKVVKRMERFSQFAVVAAKEAMEDSGLDTDSEDSYRLGVSIGSGIGSLMGIEREYDKLEAKGAGRIHPLTAPLILGNMAAANVAMFYGFQGKCIDVVTACATGTNSIGEAFRSIQHGEADVILAGGVDSSVSRFGVAAFQALTALTTSEDPLNASIPFDRRRNGFVTGEGAGVLVLEELEHAKRRNARIYAELGGYGATCDANHVTTPLEDGSAAAKAMTMAMEDADVLPEQVDYINAHGTGTVYNDLYETRAIKLAFGRAAYHVHINSTKSMVGHMFAGGGAVELITCIQSINESYIHSTVGLSEDDPECDLDYTKGEGICVPVNVAMSNSLGFGGHNATILVKKYIA
ncbi:MAG: beta-ketoacyl-ACP synthase II [Lachnospiraceae bacterium]|nr:beta-ketoacyl-ACP synthase II [Lachnospiraceae bacterium]